MPNEQTIWQICEVLLAMYERWGGLERLQKPDQANGQEGLISIWRRAAEASLPVTKSAVRHKLERS